MSKTTPSPNERLCELGQAARPSEAGAKACEHHAVARAERTLAHELVEKNRHTRRARVARVVNVAGALGRVEPELSHGNVHDALVCLVEYVTVDV